MTAVIQCKCQWTNSVVLLHCFKGLLTLWFGYIHADSNATAMPSIQNRVPTALWTLTTR